MILLRALIIWPYTAVCWIIAVSLYIFFSLFQQLCRIECSGEVHLDNAVIKGLWHEALPLYFITRQPSEHRKIIWLQHPAWYMKSIHILLRLLQIEIALGSSGHNGKQGLKIIIEHIKMGYSTMINPDGPTGPPRQLKSGIIRMSQESKAPIQIITFHCNFCLRLPTWDRKIVPLPGSTIYVHYHPVIYPQDRSLTELKETIVSMLQ